MTRLCRTWFVATLASIWALAIVPPEAAAADTNNVVEMAKQHFLRGVSFYKDGDLDAALAEFNKAYETRPDYRVLYNIGQVQAERRDHAAATRVLRQYLKEGDRELDGERRATVEQSLADLAKRVGSLIVTANVPGAEVLIDRVSVGVLPLEEPLIVNAGVREITVRKDAAVAPSRRVSVTGGEALRLEFRLETETGSREPAAATVAPSGGSPHRTRVWIAYGTAALLGAGAATFALLTRNADKVLDADLARFPGDRSQIDHDRIHLQTWAGLTDGFAAAALIAAGVGTYFLLSSPASESPPPRRTAQVALLPSGATLSLSSTF